MIIINQEKNKDFNVGDILKNLNTGEIFLVVSFGEFYSAVNLFSNEILEEYFGSKEDLLKYIFKNQDFEVTKSEKIEIVLKS